MGAFLQRLPFTAMVICLMSSLAMAQQPANIKIRRVTASPLRDDQNKQTGWTVTISFDANLDLTNGSEVSAAETGSNYKIINVMSNATVPISSPRVVRRPNIAVSNKVQFTAPLGTASTPGLNETDLFHLFAFNLTFDKSPPLESLQSPVTIQKVETDSGGNVGGPKWRLSGSKGRDDSDIYGSYELNMSRGSATTGTGDLKIAIPFPKDFWNRRSVFSPVVDIKASSDANADPDSLKFGLEWFLPVKTFNTKFVFPTIALRNTGKIEAPKNFNNINALWEEKWIFPSAQIGKAQRAFIDPFVGFELGKNLKSPLKTAEGKGLARLMVGASLVVQIPVKNVTALKGFEFDSSYVRRWPLKRELLVDKDANGNLVALALSKGPKDYSDSKLIIKINDFFGPYVGYEWGRLPPNYELVDHKWTFGLLFKAKVRSGGK